MPTNKFNEAERYLLENWQLAGEVLWHSKDRDELYRKAKELRPPDSAILYFGQIPDEVAVVL